ncbi:malonate decarboxylase holo-ACP synthase [Nonomuraea jiangxiensis]|uniref:Phosphoribosyl-dephospho-CoA transferase n=1 Tax=Nonomuraea jiangxiensis TaxID=633440 RepID=A0A1G8TH68_9ACTN|nr:malonate decarboxylase holo-ACP synthase [Nonomuraea jiangxiensis]SDJ40878.1 phosphoribosyl-dephospho-CoA transferase [Nonomuraea jiangxiensis]
MIARPHDLLLLAGGGSWEAALPDWARASLAACPWAVVRRAPCPPGLVPIGIRGPSRSQRHAAIVPAVAVIHRVPPEALRSHPRLPHLAATLLAVARLLDGVAGWGPTGGVGFELATGRPATHAESDLDVLIRTPYRWDQAEATRLVEVFATLPGRVDCQLETSRGGVNLVEWSRTKGPVMARTPDGPQLVTDPWDPA